MQEDWRARCVSLLALHVRREAHLAEAHGGATFPADLAVPAALSAGLQAEAAQQAAAASGGGGNSVANSATLASGAKQDGDDDDGDVLGSAENPLQRSWFFGKIERDEAEAILAECTGVDALMIRVSTMLGYFALSTVKWGGGGGGAGSHSNKSFTHVLIAPKGQAPHVQYVLENSRDTRAYPNVAAVVAQSPLCAGLAPAGSHTTRRAADPAAMHVPEAMPTASTGRNAVASKRNMRATAKAVAAGGSSSAAAAAAVPTSGAATAASLGLAGTGPVAGGSGMQDDGDATYGKAPPPPKAAAAMGRPLGAPPPLANPAMAGDGDATYGKAPPPPKAAAAMGRPLGAPPPLANPAMAGDGDATYGKAPPPPKAAAAAPGAGGLPPPPAIDDQDQQYGKAPKPPGATGATGAAVPPSPAPGSNFGAPGGVKLVTPGGGGGAGGGLPPPPSIDDQDQQYGKAPKPPGPGGAAPTSAAPAPGSNFGAPGGVKLVTPGGGGAAPTVAGSAGTADDQDQQYGKAPKPPGAPGGAPAAAATPPPPASMGPPAGSPPPLLEAGAGAAAGGGGGAAAGAGAAPGLTVGEASMSQRDALEALLMGERDFSTAMSVFARQYVTPLTSEAQSKGKKATLPAADVKALFANAGEIATLSADLLRQLEQRQQAGGDTYNVGDLLEQMSSRMACFAAYGAASCTSRVTYLKLTNKGSGMNKAFIDWERRVTNIAETMFTPCDDFLTKPLQRIVQYCPIIRDLIAHTQQGTPEYNSLTTALDKIEQIASYATSRRQLDLNLRELQRVKAHVTGWPSGFDLAIPTRGLVAKMVAKRHVKKKTEDFKLWLFTDVLLLSLVGKKNSFKLRGRIYLDKLRVMDVSGTAAQHCLDIMDRDDEKNKMTFSMTSAEDKVAFLAAVKTATRDHMMGDRESRVRPFLEPFEFRAPGQPRPRALSNGSSSSAGAGAAAGSGGSGTGTPGGGIFGAGSAGGSRGTIGRGGNASSVGTIGRGGSSGGLGSISGTPTGGGSGSQSPSAAAAGGGSSGSLGPPPPISTPGAAAPAGLPPPPEEDEGLYSFTPNSQRPGGGSTMPVPKMPAGPGGGAATVGGGDTYGSLAKGVPGLPPPPPAAGAPPGGSGPTAGGAENYGSMISPKAPAQPPPATYGAAPHVPRPVVGTTPAAAGPPPAPIVGGAPAMPAEDTYGKMTAPPGAPTAGGAAPPPPAAGAAAGTTPGGGLPPPPALSGGAESYGKMPTVVGGAGAGGAPPVPMSAPPPGALSVPSAATTALPGSQYYTYEQLTNPASRPANLDQTRLERYLSPAEFQTVFGMSQSDFAASPTWKQAQLKTQKKL